MEKSLSSKQLEFLEKMFLPVHYSPTLDPDALDLGLILIGEEFAELKEAIETSPNFSDQVALTKIAHEAVDLVYVVLQLVNQLGLPFDEVFDEVHKANLRKVAQSGKATKNEDGKVMKPKNWKPADVASIIEKYIEFGEKIKEMEEK